MQRREVVRLVTGLAAVVALGLAGAFAPHRAESVRAASEPAAAAPAADGLSESEPATGDPGSGEPESAVDPGPTGEPDLAGGPGPAAEPGPTGGSAPAGGAGPEGRPGQTGGAQSADEPEQAGETSEAVAASHPLPDYQPMPVERVEPLLPDPPADLPEQWKGLHEVVTAVATEYPGRISVVAVDLTSGSRYEFRPRDPYLPASTFKLPVTLCTLEAIDRGELAWDTPITYTEADWEPVGAGNFANAAFGTQWSVRNLVDRSIISSNNVAVKMLARTLTWDGLLACTTEMGGPVTRTEGGSTPVTASDEAAWWLRLWQLSQERPQLAEELLRPLRRVTYDGRIQAGTPRPELVTHKFGTYAGYDHDGAIVWGERPYVLVVMTFGGGEYTADRAIERIAAAAWEAMTRPPDAAPQFWEAIGSAAG